MTRRWLRWLPAALVPAVLTAAALAGSYQAGAAVSLPQKSAAEIIAMIGHSDVRALSGTLRQASELGLPQLPSAGPAPSARLGDGQGLAAVIELLGTPHTARIYLDGPSKARFQILDRLAERDMVRNGNDLWLYNSADNSAAHVTLPDAHAPADNHPKTATPGATTPEALAQRFLAAVDPSTEVTVGDATIVAGRTAYQLVLTPRSTATLVDSVTLAVDSASGLPLGIHLRARGQGDPAFSLEFSDISLSAPDSSVFTFTPPPGASVEEKTIPSKAPDTKHAVPGTRPSAARPVVTGKGWDTVVGFPAGMLPADVRSAPAFAQLTQAVPGGRALTSSLVTVLVLDDGRVFAGLVPLERLQAAAAPQ
ncbi:LolA family protein [Arthrobacter celericrescens]|uniref:LolA family protein n=1 Tax=Arthrobacter celericrescens TaxID=2320851 RepID=UPI0019699D25|nr:DUF2092 domain-containing protein [Arthrobacter celericrescens]